MAMSKAEKARLEAALTAAALRWTAPVERDVPIPTGREVTEGWDFNTYSATVSQKWSTATAHGDGPAPSSGYRYLAAASQGGRRLYSTKALALAALRFEVETKAAETLRSIDSLIAEANEKARRAT